MLLMMDENRALKRQAPAAERNRGPILEALRPFLPNNGCVLEIASGTGQHIVFLAEHFPHLVFQPSDLAPAALDSIRAWQADSPAQNICPPLELDVTQIPWPIKQAEFIFCANMIHIAPWIATQHLFEQASRILPVEGRLVTYGPYLVGGQPTTQSNAAFDASLRERNTEWGLRDLADIYALASKVGLNRLERLSMPANNFLLIFEKAAA